MAKKKQQSKKSNNTFVKGTLLTFLAGAIGVNYMKKLVFGSPPSKVRQYIVFGTLGAMFAYNRLGLNEYYEEYKERVNDSRLETITLLEEQNSLKENKIDSLSSKLDSLYRVNNSKDKRIQDMTQVLNQEINKREDLFKEQPSTSDYWYVVRSGETLEDVSKNIYGSKDRVDEIINLNGLTQVDLILPGKPLMVPELGIINKRIVRDDEIPTNYHLIDKGDKLSDLIRTKTGDVGLREVDAVKKHNISKGNYLNLRQTFFRTDIAREPSKVYIPR